jgi:hypothetical protein
MKFTPYKKYSLYSRFSLSDLKQRLREHLDSPKKWFYFHYDSKAYDGEIEGDEFTIFQVGSLHVPKVPDIKGRFSTSNGKTAISVTIKLSKFELQFGGAAIGFLSVCFIAMLWSNWSNTHSLRPACFVALFWAGALFLIYTVTTINILILTAQSKKFLRQLFEAE